MRPIQLDFPFDVARGHRPRRLPRHRLAADLPPLPARHVRPRSSRAARSSGADLPTISTNRMRPAYGYQLGHSWVLRSNLINEAKVNASWNGQRIPPSGDAWRRDTYGFAVPAGLRSRPLRRRASPTSASTGYAALTGPSHSLLSPTTDITFTDTLTWIEEPALRAGRRHRDAQPQGPERPAGALPGSVNFNTDGQHQHDRQRARRRAARQLPHLLGGGATIRSASSASPSIGGYVSDTWRVRTT